MEKAQQKLLARIALSRFHLLKHQIHPLRFTKVTYSPTSQLHSHGGSAAPEFCRQTGSLNKIRYAEFRFGPAPPRTPLGSALTCNRYAPNTQTASADRRSTLSLRFNRFATMLRLILLRRTSTPTARLVVTSGLELLDTHYNSDSSAQIC